MPELRIEDINQLFEGTLCRYKDSVVKVEGIRDAKTLRVFDLRTQRVKDIPFVLEEMGAPLGRIGFVNHCNWAFYITRKPLRRYQVGLSRNNIQIQAVVADNPGGHPLRQAMEEVTNLKLSTFLDSVNNVFPSFEDALEKAVERKGVYAFDRQFAVDYGRNIYFRDKFCGILPPRVRKKERIVFQQKFEHLDLLLNQDYEKTARTFAR